MSNWKHFPLAEEARPSNRIVFKSKERVELEYTVAAQAALLLSLGGEITRLEPDFAGEHEPIFYEMLELPEQELEEGSALFLTQLPRASAGFRDLSPGVYTLLHETNREQVIRDLTIHDPSHKVDHFVYDGDKLVDLVVLQELYEALGVMTRSCLENRPKGGTVHDPTHYPLLVEELPTDLLSTVDFGLASHRPVASKALLN